MQNKKLENKKLENKELVFSPIHSFIVGMGSVLDIFGSNTISLFDNRTDNEKIKGDWFNIGNDIRKSYISKLEFYNK